MTRFDTFLFSLYCSSAFLVRARRLSSQKEKTPRLPGNFTITGQTGQNTKIYRSATINDWRMHICPPRE